MGWFSLILLGLASAGLENESAEEAGQILAGNAAVEAGRKGSDVATDSSFSGSICQGGFGRGDSSDSS